MSPCRQVHNNSANQPRPPSCSCVHHGQAWLPLQKCNGRVNSADFLSCQICHLRVQRLSACCVLIIRFDLLCSLVNGQPMVENPGQRCDMSRQEACCHSADSMSTMRSPRAASSIPQWLQHFVIWLVCFCLVLVRLARQVLDWIEKVIRALEPAA